MLVGWYIVPYKRRGATLTPTRYPAIDDYTAEIHAADGQWAETEVLGNRCLVKVRAPASVLNKLDSVYKRLPKDRLDDPLADLSQGVKDAIMAELLDMGYSLAELRGRFGDDLGTYTLRHVLRFMASRRRSARWDREANEIVLDGPIAACRSVKSVDNEVRS
jgi:hypothetical protein